MGERFTRLCLDDKLRLQSLIRELGNATKAVTEKENYIVELEKKLNAEIVEKNNSEKDRKGMYKYPKEIFNLLMNSYILI